MNETVVEIPPEVRERVHFQALRVLLEDPRARAAAEEFLGLERLMELFPEIFELKR